MYLFLKLHNPTLKHLKITKKNLLFLHRRDSLPPFPDLRANIETFALLSPIFIFQAYFPPDQVNVLIEENNRVVHSPDVHIG